MPAVTDLAWQNLTHPALDEALDFTPDAEVETWRLSVPAKAACYLLEDAAGAPVLLATVANLRHALVTRLAPALPSDAAPATPRIDYRAIVHRVRYRLVHSRFEANWTYIDNARQAYPRTYRKLIRRFRGHWISVDPGAAHPRFDAADRPMGSPHACFGPLPDARSARRYIEMLEDLFDLCRYHHILMQAPHGQACAYKQMERCPAPCDGTISLDQYRAQIARAVAFLRGDHEAVMARLRQRMKEAAGALKFELAARLKAQLEAAQFAQSPAVMHLRPLSDFRYLALQPGARMGHVDAFVIHGGSVERVCSVPPRQRQHAAEALAQRMTALTPNDPPLSEPDVERLGLVCWHLCGGPREQGIYVHASDASDPAKVIVAMERIAAARTRGDAQMELEEAGSEP